MPVRKGNVMKKAKAFVKQHDISRKLWKLVTSNIFEGVREVNELEANAGKVVLSNQGIARNSLPLIVIPLLNLYMNSTTSGDNPNGILMLKQNGYDFTNVANVEHIGASGNLASDQKVSTLEFSKAIVRYINVRLLLWQSANKDVKFQVKLVKILDESLNPNTLSETNTDYQNKKKLFYMYHCLRHQLSNPLLEDFENYLRDIRPFFKILWEKTYHIQERSADYEEHHYQEVTFFKQLDRIVNYRVNPNLAPALDLGVTGVDAPDTVLYLDSATDSTISSYPKINQNLFLIITANTTLSDKEDTENFDIATLDIATKVKYTNVTSVF